MVYFRYLDDLKYRAQYIEGLQHLSYLQLHRVVIRSSLVQRGSFLRDLNAKYDGDPRYTVTSWSSSDYDDELEQIARDLYPKPA